jgi:hypothetical protein
MIKNWYNECHENTGDLNPHSKCFKFWDFSRDDRENFRPKRLLSIKSEDRHPDSVRLVSGGQVKTDDLYVALSYCW